MPQNSETAAQLSRHLLGSLSHSQSRGALCGSTYTPSPLSLPRRDSASYSNSSSIATVDDIFIFRNIFLMTIVNMMSSLSDVTVVNKDSIHMDKIVNIPSSFVIKKSCNSLSSPPPLSPHHNGNLEFGCVFFKTQDEFSFIMSRAEESSSSSSIDIACQFVLPPRLFEEAVRAGHGKPHPFAGMYHPILNITVPPTLLSIFTPTTSAGTEFLLNCVHESYLLAKEACWICRVNM